MRRCRIRHFSLGLVVSVCTVTSSLAPAARSQPPGLQPTQPPKPVEVVNETLDVEVVGGALTVEAGDALPVVVEGASEPLPVVVQGAPAEIPVLVAMTEFELNFTGRVLRIDNVLELCEGAIPSCDSGGTYRVPDDKVLILDQVSYFGEIQLGTGPVSLFATLHVGPPASTQFIFNLGRAVRSSPTDLQWLGGGPITVRAPAGSKVYVSLLWDQPGALRVAGTATLSGRLVDIP